MRLAAWCAVSFLAGALVVLLVDARDALAHRPHRMGPLAGHGIPPRPLR